MGRLLLDVSSSSTSRERDFFRVRWNRALSVKVAREGLFLDSERVGIGGLASGSCAAMIGSVPLVGRVVAGGSTTTGTRPAEDEARLPGLRGLAVTTDAGLCGCEVMGTGSVGVAGLESWVGIHGFGLFGVLPGSAAVSRRMGSTRLADMARSKRGDVGSMSLDERRGLGVACLTCCLASYWPE